MAKRSSVPHPSSRQGQDGPQEAAPPAGAPPPTAPARHTRSTRSQSHEHSEQVASSLPAKKTGARELPPSKRARRHKEIVGADLATLDEQLDENVAKPQPSRSPNAADDASVRQYYHERMEELDASVAAVGGVNSVVEQLRQEVERRQDDNRAAQIRGQFIRHGKTPRTSFGKDGIKKLKGRVDGLAATKPSADEGYAAVDHNDDGPPATAISFNTGEPQAQPEANVEDDETRTMVDGDAHLPSSTDPPGLEALALNAIKDGNRTMREHASRAGGRSLLDRQEGAYRVEFDDVIEDPSEPVAAERPRLQYPSSAGPANGPYYDQPSGNPSKRPISQVDDGDDDFDPTQDDGFEANLHSSGPAADRRRELAAIAARAASPPTHPPTHLANNDIPAPSHRPRKNPGSSIPPPIRPFDPDIDLDATNPTRLRIAHARVAARTHAVQATQRKPAQLRTPWSEDEEDALIMMIEDQCDEGISWSQLKAYDRIPGVQGDGDGGRNGDGAVTRGVLVRRSAEDMRFKARNLKVMFLQAKQPLPRNFEHVKLDRKAVLKLHDNGVQYEQEPSRMSRVTWASQ